MIEILRRVPVVKDDKVVNLEPGDEPNFLSDDILNSLVRGGDAKWVDKDLRKEDKAVLVTKEDKPSKKKGK